MSGIEIEFGSIDEDDANEEPDGASSDTSTEAARPRRREAEASRRTQFEGDLGAIDFHLKAHGLTSWGSTATDYADVRTCWSLATSGPT